MTEVALALAMAFFSLMVLTMVSMGTPTGQSKIKARSAAAAKEMVMAPQAAHNQAEKQLKKPPTLIIFWRGRFLDRNLQPFFPATQVLDGRVILALPPDLPMGEALTARAQIKSGNIVVSALNDQWLERLHGLAR